MPLYPITHGLTHQEIVGSDSLVNYGMFERIARVTKTTSNATPTMFTGDTNNVNNTLQSGHGWTALNNAAGNLNYTADSIIGTQCIKLTTDGGGVNVAKCTSPRRSMNLTAKMIRIWLKIDSVGYSNILNMWVYVGSGASAFTNFASVQVATNTPTPMNSNYEYAKPGEWCVYTLNPASFHSITGTMDWTAIQDYRVAIIDNGSGAATCYVGGIDFIANDTTYPNGVVSLTFDDTYRGQFTLARTKMEQYGYKGTFYLIQDAIEPSGSYMSQAQIDQLHTAGHEIAYHSAFAANHNATNGWVGLSNATLMNDYGSMKGWMHQKGYKGLEHCAYPQGFYDTSLLALVKQQFAAARTNLGRTVETLPVADAYRLRDVSLSPGSYVISPNTTAGSIEWILDQIALYGGWMIICCHDIVASGATGNQTNQTDFNTVMDYINTKGIPVRTVGDVLGL